MTVMHESESQVRGVDALNPTTSVAWDTRTLCTRRTQASSISTARSSPATMAATAAAISDGLKSKHGVPAFRTAGKCQITPIRSKFSMTEPSCSLLLTSSCGANQVSRSHDGAPRRRVAAVEPVEEVVDVREGSDGLHPPFERAEDQELHPLDRLGFEHVTCVPDLIDRIQH